MKRFLIISAMATLVLSACSKSDFQPSVVSDQMRFKVEYPMTRATATTFEVGDAMGVFVVEYD